MKQNVKLMLRAEDAHDSGHLPIYIQIYIDRKRVYMATGHAVPKNLWDEKNQVVKARHLQAASINADITKKKTDIMNYIVGVILQGGTRTADQVRRHFTRTVDLHNIFDFIDDFRNRFLHKRAAGTIENYKKYSRKLLEYNKSRDLAFEQMTPDWLEEYERSLRNEGLNGNYIWSNFKMLKTFFNAAIKRKLIAYYPFNEIECPEYNQKQKEVLTREDLGALEIYADNVGDNVQKQTAAYFLLGCYSGLRISDWFQFDPRKHIVKNRLRIRATKNGEWVTMNIHPMLNKALERVKNIPLTIEEPTINEALKVIAARLDIEKHLTSHSGRHTFAVTVCADLGVTSETCAELMGITIKTCVENYYRVTNRKIDAECEKAWSKFVVI